MKNKLTKQEVLDIIITNVNKAYSNNKDGFADLCMLFESSYGYSIDMRLKFNKETGMFEVWEETNLN